VYIYCTVCICSLGLSTKSSIHVNECVFYLLTSMRWASRMITNMSVVRILPFRQRVCSTVECTTSGDMNESKYSLDRLHEIAFFTIDDLNLPVIIAISFAILHKMKLFLI
jgi:hypothetical protein